ncbi:MAG TPA: (E)-4-hydroxy-3-methylbut-2-enyl-diphosphate synthase [Myxococcota bacterium]|nr:(E)-4-hydroxy-3-methylbut-2-enyl-diphosphate synthase [Myxococcota bacterium]
MSYTVDPFAPRRRKTRVVRVGDVAIGGDHPVRVQSMTTTDTLDTVGTADQVERLAAAGCEIARITAPSRKEAENLAAIRAELFRRGVRIPLVADIHYTPGAALIAAEHVEKVRVNPGNYADKKKFEVRDYSDAEYAEEVERAAERFRPLVRRLRELGRALRIGTNHGSLADRILNRYGDTPRGMVESALEFLDVCEDENYYDLVFSMKASNAQVAIQAYRLLAARLEERNPGAPGYPFHVGVTEAGDGEDGRIKSAIGIGALFEDGLGDTIRVSLTEDPVKEVPVAAALARRAAAHWARRDPAPAPGAPFADDPYSHRRRSTRSLGAIGGANPVRVELALGPVPADPEAAAAALARSLAEVREVACEGLCFDVHDVPDQARLAELGAALREQGLALPIAVRAESRLAVACAQGAARLVVAVGALIEDAELAAVARAGAKARVPVEWELRGALADVPALADRALAGSRAGGLDDFAISVDAPLAVHAARAAAARLRARGAADVPIVLRHRRHPEADESDDLLDLAVDLGAPLCDGIGDAVVLDGFPDAGRATDLAYRVLQGARLRTTRTEFISCPSCGRTLFDLEETTARIKARTSHLVGLKIAVMGCIVNGPGEMADADFGYVGSGPGTVNLFVGHECVERHVPAGEATDRLVALIQRHGQWIDPPA